MKKLYLLLTMLIPALLVDAVSASAKEPSDCTSLKQSFQTGVTADNGVCHVNLKREDIDVSHMGKRLSPEMMDMGFMANFQNTEHGTAVIGEFALLEGEINPVIDALRRGGLEITAVHNHMIGESPRIMYLHFQGMGRQAQLAEAIKNAIAATKHK